MGLSFLSVGSPTLEYSVLTHGLSGSTAKPHARPAWSHAQALLLRRQQPDCERIGDHHDDERHIEADDGSDELVERVRDLAGSCHKHAVVVLQHQHI